MPTPINQSSPQLELCLQVQETLAVEPQLVNLEQWQAWFQKWAELLISAPGEYELTLRLSDDLEIQALNAQYRHLDQPTDVLAFAASEVDFPELNDGFDPIYLGDIIISLTTAHKQAQAQAHPALIELAWLACHGFLHLLGWDHPDRQSLRAMIEMQKKCLSALGLELGLGSEF